VLGWFVDNGPFAPANANVQGTESHTETRGENQRSAAARGAQVHQMGIGI